MAENMYECTDNQSSVLYKMFNLDLGKTISLVTELKMFGTALLRRPHGSRKGVCRAPCRNGAGGKAAVAKTVLESQYDSMKRYVDLKLNRIGKDGLIDSGYEFDDWLALDRDELMPVSGPGSTDSYFVSNAYFTVVLGDMVEAAFAIGRAEEGKYYASRREDLISVMRREYFTATGRMACETQTDCALAIALGIVPLQFKEMVSSALCRNVKNHGNRLTTGFAGTPYLLFALSGGGNHALAAKLLLSRSYPGWLYAVDRGATTVWERWNGILPDGSFSDPSMNSFNHYSNGSVIEFIYRGIAGKIVRAQALKR